jgi:hypothetical protein
VTSAVGNSEVHTATPTLLGRVSVRARIYFGFGTLVVLSAGVAAFSIIQFGTIGTDVQRSTSFTANTVRVLDAERLFESMRKDALRNETSWDEGSAKTFGQSKAEVIELLAAASKSALSEERRKTYDGVARRAEELATEFSQLAKLTGGQRLTARRCSPLAMM